MTRREQGYLLHAGNRENVFGTQIIHYGISSFSPNFDSKWANAEADLSNYDNKWTSTEAAFLRMCGALKLKDESHGHPLR